MIAPGLVLAAPQVGIGSTGQARLVQVTSVGNLPSASGGTPAQDRVIPLLVPDPAALAKEKALAQGAGYVPPLESQKTISGSVATGPFTVSINKSLAGAPGGSPNLCACSPPDGNVAVGPNHVFEVVNVAGIIYFKTGAIAKSTFALSGLFSLPSATLSDPQVIYDSLSGRWFASILDITDNRTQFAVSTSSDPTGTWLVYTFVSASKFLPDQPFIGASDDKFVISANDFLCLDSACSTATYEGFQYWVLNKAELVSGATTVDFATSTPDPSGFSVQPARHLTTSSGLFYMVTVGVGSTSTGHLFILSGTPPSNVAVATFSFGIGALSNPPGAIQPGTSALLNTNDDRVLSAVWESGALWFSANDACIPGGDSTTRSCLRLVQLSTSGTSAPTKQQDFDFASSGNYVFYPAVSMDLDKNLVVLFGESSSTLFPSLFATGRQFTDAVDTLQTPVVIATGSADDLSTRYGDYFGASTDPSVTATFWLQGEYRASTSFSGWSTEIAKVVVPVPTSGSATISVVEDTLGGEGTFLFTTAGCCAGTIPSVFSMITSGGTGSLAIINVDPAHTYGVAEIVPAGWKLESVGCSGQTTGDQNSFTVASGGKVTCIFHGSKLATITVVKNTLGGDGTFSFTTAGASWHSSFSIATAGGSGTDTSVNVDPDNVYGVAETPIPSGWKFESEGCTGQASGTVSSFTVTPGATVTCSFHDSKLASIKVVKDTLGGDGTFSFTTAGGGWHPSFQVATSGGTGSDTSSSIDPDNTYGVAETPIPMGWKFEGSSCSGQASGTVSSFTVAPGSAVTCTFHDSKMATITIVKNTLGGDGIFFFTTAGGSWPSSFSITTTSGFGSMTFINIDPDNSYGIAEIIPSGWTLSSASCTTGTPSSFTATPGTTVTCTFDNSK